MTEWMTNPVSMMTGPQDDFIPADVSAPASATRCRQLHCFKPWNACPGRDNSSLTPQSKNRTHHPHSGIDIQDSWSGLDGGATFPGFLLNPVLGFRIHILSIFFHLRIGLKVAQMIHRCRITDLSNRILQSIIGIYLYLYKMLMKPPLLRLDLNLKPHLMKRGSKYKFRRKYRFWKGTNWTVGVRDKK